MEARNTNSAYAGHLGKPASLSITTPITVYPAKESDLNELRVFAQRTPGYQKIYFCIA